MTDNDNTQDAGGSGSSGCYREFTCVDCGNRFESLPFPAETRPDDAEPRCCDCIDRMLDAIDADPLDKETIERIVRTVTRSR